MDVDTRRFWNGIAWVEIDPVSGRADRPAGATTTPAGDRAGANALPSASAPVLGAPVRPRTSPQATSRAESPPTGPMIGPRVSPEPMTAHPRPPLRRPDTRAEARTETQQETQQETRTKPGAAWPTPIRRGPDRLPSHRAAPGRTTRLARTVALLTAVLACGATLGVLLGRVLESLVGLPPMLP